MLPPIAVIESTGTEEIITLLIRRQAELNSLLEITQAINRNYPEATIFQMFEFVLKMHLRVGKLRLFISNNNVWNAAAGYGLLPLSPKQQLALCRKVSQYKEITYLENSKDKDFSEYSVLIPVSYNEDQFAYVLLGEYELNAHANSDASFIQTILNVIMVAIENKRLFKERIVREGLQKEIDLAGQVQSMLFPREVPKNKKIEIDAVYLPHHSIGGDYYDYIEVSDHEFLFCIADVTGKGISAALLMANFQANLRALTRQGHTLPNLVRELNSILFASTKGDKFITLFVGLLNTQTCTLDFINAGHHPPFVVKGNTTRTLESGTTVIGVFDELPFLNPGRMKLEQGSLIFCYTDGLVELEEDDFLFDIEGLRQYIEQNNKLKPADINRKLIKHIRNKTSRDLFDDDITLLTFRCS